MAGGFSNTACWIWVPINGETHSRSAGDEWVMFRKSFAAPKGCRSAVLRITAGFYYIAYVNGYLVGRGPGRSYDFSKTYDEIDISPFLKPGSPALVAVVSLAGQCAGFQPAGRNWIHSLLHPLIAGSDGRQCAIAARPPHCYLGQAWGDGAFRYLRQARRRPVGIRRDRCKIRNI